MVKFYQSLVTLALILLVMAPINLICHVLPARHDDFTFWVGGVIAGSVCQSIWLYRNAW